LDEKGYICIIANGKIQRLHRLVYKIVNGDIKKGNEIHHIDGDKTNANPSNLIELTKAQHRDLHRLLKFDIAYL